jgi:transcription initiation factor IIE alpha subunit
MMTTAYCPDCEETVSFRARPKLGQRFSCPSCASELEVINLSPLELDWAYDEPETDWEEEDWEEEDWEEDEWEEDEEDNDL